MDPYQILKFPNITEKSINFIEKENKLVFVVDRKSKKQDIKSAFEELFEVKVEKINVLITRQGQKKAFIKLKPEHQAADIAVRLGMV